MKIFSLLIITLFILTGCSTKKYFEPEETNGDFEQNSKDMPAKIIEFNRSGATLENGQVVTKNEISQYKLPEGYEFINTSKNGIIATDNKSKIIIKDKSNTIDVGGIVVAASIKDSILAIVYSNNSFALYDLDKKKYLLKEYLTESLANDTRITNPIFMQNLVLFPTLNGKIKVVALKEKKIVRTITVDTEGTFSNIIYLNVVENTLIAATSNKLVTVGTGNVSKKEYQVRDVITNKKNIYVATIDGQLIKLDFDLNVLAQKKYKFARFYAIAFGTSLYALESQGYIINVDEDFKKDKILDFSFDAEQKAIAIGNKLYFGDEYLELK